MRRHSFDKSSASYSSCWCSIQSFYQRACFDFTKQTTRRTRQPLAQSRGCRSDVTATCLGPHALSCLSVLGLSCSRPGPQSGVALCVHMHSHALSWRLPSSLNCHFVRSRKVYFGLSRLVHSLCSACHDGFQPNSDTCRQKLSATTVHWVVFSLRSSLCSWPSPVPAWTLRFVSAI